MTERHPNQYVARSEVLLTMAKDGWATASGGDTKAPTGFFAYFINQPNELESIIDEFDEAMHTAGLTDTSLLLGNFLLVENQDGIDVTSYTSMARLEADFNDLARRYGAWQKEQQ